LHRIGLYRTQKHSYTSKKTPPSRFLSNTKISNYSTLNHLCNDEPPSKPSIPSFTKIYASHL
jgi:hypothetical protein